MMIGHPHTGLFYSAFLAECVRLTGAATYLEIGVQNGDNLSGITVDTAIGVDPSLPLTTPPMEGKRQLSLYLEPSDSFFASPPAWLWKGKVDFAFLDGMHLAEYLLRDFFNTEAMSNPHGIIVMHDCLPFDEHMIEREYRPELRTGLYTGAWTGDVWKVTPMLQKHRPDLKITLLDCAPTGLVCVSNLDPKSTALKTRYAEIVEEMVAIPNSRASLERFYAENPIVSAEAALKNIKATLFR